MHFCSAEVFFLLSVLVWNENNGAFGQGKHTKCLFSLKVAFLSRLLTSEHFHRKLTPSLLDFSALVNEPRDSSQMTENSLNYTLVSRQIREESRCGKSVFFGGNKKGDYCIVSNKSATVNAILSIRFSKYSIYFHECGLLGPVSRKSG